MAAHTRLPQYSAASPSKHCRLCIYLFSEAQNQIFEANGSGGSYIPDATQITNDAHNRHRRSADKSRHPNV